MPRGLAPAALALALLAAPAAAQAPTEGPWRSVVPRDGDSLIVSVRAGPITAMEVRLAGIDAPEAAPRAKCREEAEAADRATVRLRELTKDRVRLVSMLEFDAYGRLIARAWTRDKRDVSAVMLAEGLVRPQDGGERRKPWCGP